MMRVPTPRGASSLERRSGLSTAEPVNSWRLLPGRTASGMIESAALSRECQSLFEKSVFGIPLCSEA
jgi:hypothetical protein